MAQSKVQFVCRECGGMTAKWSGRCPHCSQWDTLTEETVRRNQSDERPTLGDGAGPTPISEVETDDFVRRSIGIPELDLVLGGGLVAGSATLIGGDPGIGKSTLLLQALNLLAEKGAKALYVSAEESARQLKLRAERLGLNSPRLLVAAETEVGVILNFLKKEKPDVLVVDSIQMVYHADFPAAPGTIGQIRESAQRFVYHAKQSGLPVLLVGHITKDGSLAGPKALEHIVDTVLYFEGDRFHTYRLLRAVKNRFGPCNEIGVFEMTSQGLQGVENPSAAFLSNRGTGAPGAAIVPVMEGTRALLVEVQALVASATFGTPHRKVAGADPNRVAMLLAVLEKRCGFLLGGYDVYVNVVGGVEIDDPAADLAIAAAVASSFKDVPIPFHAALIGEIGLGGEIRPVGRLQPRLQEAQKLGFKTALVPEGAPRAEKSALEIIPVPDLPAALDKLFL